MSHVRHSERRSVISDCLVIDIMYYLCRGGGGVHSDGANDRRTNWNLKHEILKEVKLEKVL